MNWQDMGAILLWCVATVHVVQHLVLTYTNRAPCNGCSHKPPGLKQRNKPILLGLSLQRGLKLAHNNPHRSHHQHIA